MTTGEVESAELEPQPAEGGMARRMGDLEVFLGLVVACFAGIVGVGLFGLVNLVWDWTYGVMHLSLRQRVLLSVAWLVVMACEGLSIRWIGMNWRLAAHPRPIRMAERQARVNVAAGSIVAAWWLAHAVLAVATADWIVRQYSFSNANTAETVFLYAMMFGMLFGSAFASNVFVLLALGAARVRPGALAAAWRLRVPLDLAVTLALIAWRRG